MSGTGEDESERLGGPDGDDGMKPLASFDPTHIGPYQLLGRLGAGGMGRVYLARSESGRTVAVKVVHEEHVSDAQFRARFRREITAARRVGERYTAPVLDADPDAEPPWIATGYVPGLSLEQVVRQHGPLPNDAVYGLADGLLRALKDIHDAGIVHRDLKPSNVMLTVDGTRIIDFGIARALETSVESLLTSTGMVIGSPGFMSPEQIRGERAEASSDVFTVGCVLMYAATGRLPFGHGASNPHAVMYQVTQGEPNLESLEDAGLRALVARCLAKEPEQRPTVTDLLGDGGPDSRSGPSDTGGFPDPRDSSGPSAPRDPSDPSDPSDPRDPPRARPGAAAAARTAAARTAAARTGGAATGGAWLPAEVVAHIAQRSARLLDAEAIPLREEPRGETRRLTREAPVNTGGPDAPEDLSTVRLGTTSDASEPAEDDGRETQPELPQAKAPRQPKEPRRRRRTVIALPVVLVLGVGGGTAALLPYVMNNGHHGSHASRTSPPSASGITPLGSVSPGAPSGSSSGSPTSSPSKRAKKKESGKPDGSGGSTTGAGSGPTSSSGAPGSSGGSGDSAGSGTGTGTGTGTGSGGSSSSGGSSGPGGTSSGSKPANLTGYKVQWKNSCVGACDMPVIVSWSPVSRATRYDIHYTNKGSQYTAKNVDEILSTGSTSYTINGPYSGDKICVSVRAANKYGASAWAQTWCDTVPY
ncbi:protein kinase domain-containing protein [Streptomyces beihaiensis]|uniref:non-specific serine/threonine protein kinase n=1 Tax=Streptomyces beihaiensis TaxID=2984495 RepID=A0ABT3U1R5_9ACTN|nr:protein kinase [Streptomyces beihaiensis]MCX3062200.1 protein kinase [Streptomyces beihaiensis]